MGGRARRVACGVAASLHPAARRLAAGASPGGCAGQRVAGRPRGFQSGARVRRHGAPARLDPNRALPDPNLARRDTTVGATRDSARGQAGQHARRPGEDGARHHHDGRRLRGCRHARGTCSRATAPAVPYRRAPVEARHPGTRGAPSGGGPARGRRGRSQAGGRSVCRHRHALRRARGRSAAALADGDRGDARRDGVTSEARAAAGDSGHRALVRRGGAVLAARAAALERPAG